MKVYVVSNIGVDRDYDRGHSVIVAIFESLEMAEEYKAQIEKSDDLHFPSGYIDISEHFLIPEMG